MARIPHPRTSYHADFSTLPLGLWAAGHGLIEVSAGGRHIQKRVALPTPIANTYAEIHGLGRESSRRSSFKSLPRRYNSTAAKPLSCVDATHGHCWS